MVVRVLTIGRLNGIRLCWRQYTCPLYLLRCSSDLFASQGSAILTFNLFDTMFLKTGRNYIFPLSGLFFFFFFFFLLFWFYEFPRNLKMAAFKRQTVKTLHGF